MEVFIARQPIFDKHLNVVAYELLYRSGNIDHYESLNGDKATKEVISNSLLTIGLDTLTNGKRGFINFTENLLKNETALLLPENKICIEILENVSPSEDTINACIKLKEMGYVLALDDFVLKPEYLPFIDLADIIKVDFKISGIEERRNIINAINSDKIKFLAEKVETQEEFYEAIDCGYSYFQGYFFSKPVMVSAQDVPPIKLNQIRMLKELNRPDIDFNEIENIIKMDVSLSYKLLRFINSANFGFKTEVHSIKHALVILGKEEILKWISLLALKNLSSDSPEELMINSVIRAKFAENIANSTELKDRASDAFLMGLFSNIDVLMHRPLSELLADIALPEDVKDALLGRHNKFRYIYNLIVAYERGNWNKSKCYAAIVSHNKSNIPELYINSLKWSSNFLNAGLNV